MRVAGQRLAVIPFHLSVSFIQLRSSSPFVGDRSEAVPSIEMKATA